MLKLWTKPLTVLACYSEETGRDELGESISTLRIGVLKPWTLLVEIDVLRTDEAQVKL